MIQAVEKLTKQQSSLLQEVRSHAERLEEVESNALIRRLKKVGRGIARRDFRFEAIPLAQVKAVDAAAGKWESSGTDPSLVLLSQRSGFPRGWVLVDIDLSLDVASFAPPCLYIDQGSGFSESFKLPLPRPSHGRVQGLIRLPDRVTGLRFDPLGEPGTFTLGKVSLREVSPAEAATRIAGPTLLVLAREPRRLAGALLKGARTVRDGGFTALRQRLVEKMRRESPQAEYAEWRRLFADLGDGRCCQS